MFTHKSFFIIIKYTNCIKISVVDDAIKEVGGVMPEDLPTPNKILKK
jgi:hypothetical protein